MGLTRLFLVPKELSTIEMELKASISVLVVRQDLLATSTESQTSDENCVHRVITVKEDLLRLKLVHQALSDLIWALKHSDRHYTWFRSQVEETQLASNALEDTTAHKRQQLFRNFAQPAHIA